MPSTITPAHVYHDALVAIDRSPREVSDGDAAFLERMLRTDTTDWQRRDLLRIARMARTYLGRGVRHG